MSVRDRMNAYSLTQESINNTTRHRRRNYLARMLDFESLGNEILNLGITFSTEWGLETNGQSESTSELTVSQLNKSSSVELFNPGTQYKYTDPICCICTNDYTNKSIIRILACNHKFCIQCIDTWFANNTKCPTCKFDLVN